MTTLTYTLPDSYIGSISHGTMLARDLIPSIIDVMCDVPWENQNDHFRASLREGQALMDAYEALRGEWSEQAENLMGSEAVSYFLNEDLWSIMQEIAPDGTTFGSHPGDGADMGFFPSEDDMDDDWEEEMEDEEEDD